MGSIIYKKIFAQKFSRPADGVSFNWQIAWLTVNVMKRTDLSSALHFDGHAGIIPLSDIH